VFCLSPLLENGEARVEDELVKSRMIARRLREGRTHKGNSREHNYGDNPVDSKHSLFSIPFKL
jgi:hypothetical protein